MFRSLGKSKIAFVLAILFGVSLLFFKTGSRYSNFFNSDQVVATVSGTSISTAKFNRTMQMNINKFGEMLGKQLNGEEVRGFQIHLLALRALINDAAFEDEYDNINFKIDEKVIAQKTKEKIPQLYDTNNKLNELYLNSFLKQQQLKIEDVVQIISFETRNDYFNDAFFNINYPKYFNNKILNFDKHQREITFIELEIDQILDNEITQNYKSSLEEELKKFYNQNIINYMSKEKRIIEYFTIDKQNLSLDFNPTLYDVEEYYNLNKELFFEDEKRSFIQFNFKTKEEAVAFKSKIQNLDLNKILELSSNSNIKYNEFKELKSNEILDEISTPLFKLSINEQSNIIETSLAKHIVILKSIIPEFQSNLDQVKEKITLDIKRVESNNYFNNVSEQITEKILNGETINEIAASLGFKKEILKDITKNYNTIEDKNKLFISDLINKSFASNKDFVSDVINLNENFSYVFNVAKIDLPQELDFEEVSDKLYIDWINTKKIEKIKLDTLKNEDNLNFIPQIANKYSLDIKNITITKNSTDLPLNIINTIFESNIDKHIQNISDKKFYIIKLDKVIISNQDNESKLSSISNDLRGAFGEELLGRKNISTNQNLVSAIIDQY